MLTTLVFGFIAFAVIVTALGTILTRNAVVAVMLLVTNFLLVAFLYLLLGAPFIAMSQVAVYAGAIMVLFLFVVMMLGSDKLKTEEPLKGLRGILALLAVIFLLGLGFLIFRSLGTFPAIPSHSAGFGDPKEIGKLLFGPYVLPMIAVSLLLLVAAVGAVLLSKKEPLVKASKKED